MNHFGHPELADLRSIAAFRHAREAALRASRRSLANHDALLAVVEPKRVDDRPCRPRFEPVRRPRRIEWG